MELECFSCEASGSHYDAIALNSFNVENCCSSVRWKISQLRVKYTQMMNRRLAARSTVQFVQVQQHDFLPLLARSLASCTFISIFSTILSALSLRDPKKTIKKCLEKQQKCCSVETVKDRRPGSCIKAAFCHWCNQSVVIAAEHGGTVSAYCLHQFLNVTKQVCGQINKRNLMTAPELHLHSYNVPSYRAY